MSDDLRLYLRIHYQYPSARIDSGVDYFTVVHFVDTEAGGRLLEFPDGTDVILTAERGAEIRVRPGYLWKEKVLEKRKPLTIPPGNEVMLNSKYSVFKHQEPAPTPPPVAPGDGRVLPFPTPPTTTG